MKDMLAKWGVTPERVTSMGTAKHIFSHVEWHMRGFYVRIENADSIEKLPGNIKFVTREELKNEYTLPVAFHFYLKKILEET